jgi:COP9 signalosome complex subunit 2
MLSYVDCAAVTRNASEKKLNSLLDFIGASSDTELLQQFYETTLKALEKARNDRWV